MSIDLVDLACRFASLAREVSPQLLDSLPSGPPATQLAALASKLEQLLHALPAADARHHRYRLVRKLVSQLNEVVAPFVDSPELASCEAIAERCLAHDAFRQTCAALHTELERVTANPEWAAEVASAIADERSAPSSSGSEGSAVDAVDELSLLLQAELNADLPPFMELPGARRRSKPCMCMQCTCATHARVHAHDLACACACACMMPARPRSCAATSPRCMCRCMLHAHVHAHDLCTRMVHAQAWSAPCTSPKCTWLRRHGRACKSSRQATSSSAITSQLMLGT